VCRKPADLTKYTGAGKQAASIVLGMGPFEKERELVACEKDGVTLQRGLIQVEGRPLAEDPPYGFGGATPDPDRNQEALHLRKWPSGKAGGSIPARGGPDLVAPVGWRRTTGTTS
jgi:hypothetical protein